MGYNTEFTGSFKLNRALSNDELKAFDKATSDHCVVRNKDMPDSYCCWEFGPTDATDSIHELRWDGGEKFYDYHEWLKIIVELFVKPWGCTLNGIVQWQGDDVGDVGVLKVTDNAVWMESGTTIESIEAERNVSEAVVLDLVKLRNELATAKKGSVWASKKLDALIQKYGV
jgi:hypothetical protein